LFGGVVLGDSADSELRGFSIGHGLGIAVPREALWGLGAFDRWGELVVPLRLGLSSPFGISSLDSGTFTEESGKISHRVLYDGSSQKKRTQHNGRFKLSLPVGSTEMEPSRALSGGVGAGDGLEVRSLILIPDALFITSF
jgi:hypothetical protein